jgi:hypothetical protein
MLRGSSVTGLETGVPAQGSSAQAWLRNLRTMRAVSAEFGMRYLAVLQPALGVGSYQPSPDELQRALASQPPKDYSTFYPEALRRISSEPWIVDLTEVFVGLHDVYRDNCHVTEAGNQRVAAAILEELDRRGWLPSPTRR